MNWLSFHNRCKYHCATLIYKTLNGMSPPYMVELLTPASNERYSLRSVSNQDLTLNNIPKTKYYKDSFTYYGRIIWNDIPIDIRNANKLKTFKSKYLNRFK